MGYRERLCSPYMERSVAEDGLAAKCPPSLSVIETIPFLRLFPSKFPIFWKLCSFSGFTMKSHNCSFFFGQSDNLRLQITWESNTIKVILVLQLNYSNSGG